MKTKQDEPAATTTADRLKEINKARTEARAKQQLAERTLQDLQGGTVGGSDWNWPDQLGERPATRALAIRMARRAGEDARREQEQADDAKGELLKQQRRQEVR